MSFRAGMVAAAMAAMVAAAADAACPCTEAAGTAQVNISSTDDIWRYYGTYATCSGYSAFETVDVYMQFDVTGMLAPNQRVVGASLVLQTRQLSAGNGNLVVEMAQGARVDCETFDPASLTFAPTSATWNITGAGEVTVGPLAPVVRSYLDMSFACPAMLIVRLRVPSIPNSQLAPTLYLDRFAIARNALRVDYECEKGACCRTCTNIAGRRADCVDVYSNAECQASFTGFCPSPSYEFGLCNEAVFSGPGTTCNATTCASCQPQRGGDNTHSAAGRVASGFMAVLFGGVAFLF